MSKRTRAPYRPTPPMLLSGEHHPFGAPARVACVLQSSCPTSVPAHRDPAVHHVAPRCAELSRISRGFNGFACNCRQLGEPHLNPRAPADPPVDGAAPQDGRQAERRDAEKESLHDLSAPGRRPIGEVSCLRAFSQPNGIPPLAVVLSMRGVRHSRVPMAPFQRAHALQGGRPPEGEATT